MKIPAVIALAVVTLVLGIALGSVVCPGDDPTADPSADVAEKERLTEEVARLEAALEAEREASGEGAPDESAPEVEAPADAAGKPTEGSALDAAPAGEALERYGPSFFAEEFSGVLKKVDWKTVGTNMHEMGGLIASLLGDLKAGSSPSPETIGRIQQLNGPLVAAALQVQADLPGVGVNGRFTDPSFMVNAMSATLEAAELPLSPEQAKALERTARSWMEVDARRREAYGEDAYQLTKICDEVELKAKFFDDAFAIYTPEQLEVLTNPETKDRVRLDIFSEALVYSPLARPLTFSTIDELTDEFARGALSTFKLKADTAPRIRETVSAWLGDVPPELIDRESNALDLQGLVEADRVNAWARHTVDLMERLADHLQFDEQNRARARGHYMEFVPVKRPAQGD
jgi:hypothetical protein